MDCYNIIQEYMEICPWSMTPELLHSAFSTTGIFPFNDALFTDDNFAPAKSFSHTMHILKSFPAEVPSSPPVVSSDFSDLETSGNKSNAAESMAVDAPAEHHSWDTDSSDFDYELALDRPSHCPAPAAAATPPAALPCQLAVPGVPISGTISMSSSLVPTLRAISTILASCSSPIMPPTLTPPAMSDYVGTSGSPRPFNALSNDMPHAPHVAPYHTHSQATQIANLSIGSPPALLISITLDPTLASQPPSVQELLGENRQLRMKLDLAKEEIAMLKANNDASNAHCTIMTRVVTAARADLDHQKRKTHRAVKTSTRYVAHTALKDEWNASQQEKAWCAKETAETEAQKATDEALHEACIQMKIQTRMFSSVC